MTRSVPRSAALLAAIWVSAAAALGLGDIDVRSRLNQRFVAAIPLTAANADDLQNLKVSLASNDEFERAGVERPAYLSSLRFEIKTDGTPRIEITSDQPAREPFLTLLLDVRDGGNRLVREYTVFLDPPDYAAPAEPESEFYETATESARRGEQPVASPAPRPEPTTTQEAPSAPQPPARPAVEPQTPPPSEAVANRYGPIQASETLWSVATRLRPDGVTMDQMLLALYTGNPAAFDGGINGLLKGVTLTVPTAEEIGAVDPAAAREEVQRLRGAMRAQRPASEVETTPPAARTAPIILPESRTEPERAPEPAPEPLVEPMPEPAEAAPVEPMPTEPAPAESAATPAPETPAVEEPNAAVEGVAQPSIEAPSIEEPSTATAPEIPAPSPQDEIVVTEPERTAASDESGLLETLLLPLIGGLLVLGGIGLLVSRILARRKSAGSGAAPTVARPAAPSVVAKPAAAAGAATAAARRSPQDEFEDLQATLDQAAQGKTQQIAPQGSDTQQIKTQQLSTQQLPTTSAPARAAAAPAAEEEAVDFDLTGQFESQTVQINLDANDPVSEADFHLAYGLYDEAALLLKQAAEKEPKRADIRMKLAETYFAAGKPIEFQECAAAARPMLSAADWQKLAIMGQQLAPDAPLFHETGSAAAEPSAAVDLDLGTIPAEPGPATAAPAAAAPDIGLEFNLDDLEVPKVDEPKLELASGDKGDALEFDLTQFDLAAPPEAAQSEARPAAAAEARGGADDGLDFDLDLGSFDTELPKKSEPAQPEPAQVPQKVLGMDLADEVADVQLDDIDLGDMPIEGGLAPADEAGTKLDLARAYVDMGDNDMARALLDEVVQQGNDQQKQEAQTLIARLA